eukprot:gene11264-11414_t
MEALHTKVERPREHAVDAEVFAQLTECGLNMIRRGQAANRGRTPADFVAALRNQYVNDPLAASGPLQFDAFDWPQLGAEVSHLHRRAPGLQCMVGPISAEIKARRTVVRQAKRPVLEATRPEELQNIHAEEKQETDRHMANMWRVLCGLGAGRKVSFSHVVCNHKSFAQTVENIFTLSFLVRDQRVRLLSNVETGLTVQAVSKAEKDAAASQGLIKPQQFMVSFTMEDYEVMRKLVQPSQCLMDHRAPQAEHAVPASAAVAAGNGAQHNRAYKRARQSAS